MRDRLNLPIEYDQLHFGFYYTEPVSSFPSVEITEGELVALFVAQKALEQYKQTPFEKQLEASFRKISEGLKDKISFRWNDLDTGISFRSAGRSVADLELFKIVSKAVFDSTELEFEYKKLGSSRHERRRVQGYHLGCIENQWYLFGLDLARGELRTFALPRMRKARDSRKRFRKAPQFSISNLLSTSFGVFKGKGDYKVRIRFDPFAARLVSERLWHESQKFKQRPDGEAELTMHLDNLEEVERWVLSWGVHAQVLEPKELMSRLQATAAELQRRYG
jgi:predicted DNA-binding transcriptional regulator YafY